MVGHQAHQLSEHLLLEGQGLRHRLDHQAMADLIEGHIGDFLKKGCTLVVHAQRAEALVELFSTQGVAEHHWLDDRDLPPAG